MPYKTNPPKKPEIAPFRALSHFRQTPPHFRQTPALSTTLAKAARPQATPYDLRDSRVRGLLLRVNPTGLKTWYLQVERGQRRRLGAFPSVTYEMARTMAEALIGNRARGEVIPTKKPKVMTLGEFLTLHYRPHVNAHHRAAKGTLGVLDAQFSHWYSRRLSALTQEDLSDWRTMRLASGIAKATVNRQCTTIKTCFQQAVTRGLIAANPFQAIKPFRVDNGRVRFLSNEERVRFLAAMAAIKDDSRQAHLWLPVLTAYYTGLRLGEINALAKSNIDLERKLITVPGISSKSGKTRHVPIHDELAAALRERWRELPERGLLHLGRPKRSWRTLMETAQLENFTFHSLRHDFASRLIMAGVDLRTVQSLLGHASPMMTMRYAHLAPDHVAGAIAKL